MTTTATDAARLIDEIGYVRTPEAVEALGYKFDQGLPEVGEVVWAWGRGGYRRGIVVKVGRKNARIEYVTEGGLAESERIHAFHLFRSAVEVAEKMTARAEKNFDFFVQELDPTTRQYRISDEDLAKYAGYQTEGREGYVARVVTKALDEVEEDRQRATEVGRHGYATVSGASASADKIARQI